MNQRNQFLLRVGSAVKKGRRRFWDDHDISMRLSSRMGQPEAGLWFRTQGCQYDKQGGCIMCDYSAGLHTTAEQMIGYVREGLRQIPHPCTQLLVSPSGSMLDEKEVPRPALDGILTMLRASVHDVFSFETRADTINDDIINHCQDRLNGRLYRIFVGLESANPWVSKYCINKMLEPDTFINAHRVLKRFKVRTAANILICSPFLSVAENIKETIRAVKWVLQEGVEECFLFPLHVKEATPLIYLYNEGLFQPPSLWTLVEVLDQLGPEIAREHIRLSWYTSYGGGFNIKASPTTCEKCYEKVIPLLDRFADFADYDAIDKLKEFKCECKDKWTEQLSQIPNKPLPDRVAEGYEVLGRKILGDTWWQENHRNVLNGLYEEAESLTIGE